MTAFTETLLQMNLTAGVVILAVMLARVLLRRFPRRFSYLLWAVVAFRLCVPFSLPSPMSLFNAVDTSRVETEIVHRDQTVSAPVIDTEREQIIPSPEVSVPVEDVYVPQEQPPVTEAPTVEAPVVEETPALRTETPAESPVEESFELPDWVMPAFWLVGMLCVLGYGFYSWRKARKLLSTAVLLEENVYGSDRIGSPFAMGLFRPRIYIPFDLQGESKEYILAHERYHLRRGDHLVKLFAFCLLAFHWFNPLCWLAFNRMGLDMELSCDEGVLAGYDDPAVKKNYARTLLSFATQRRLPVPSPVSFSETASAKARIKNALYWKKSSLWASVLAVFLCICLLLTCGFDPMAAELATEPSAEDVEVTPPEDLPPEPEQPQPPQDVTPPETVTEDLEYELNKDGQSYTVISAGNYSGDVLNVPSHHADGKPITAIGTKAFAGSVLTTVYLPDTVKTVGTNAFGNSHELEFVRMPKNAELGEGVFIYCENLRQVILPEALKILPGETFRGCLSLQEIYFPEGLTVIGNFSMEGCRSLKEIYIPDSVQYIQQSAFAECASLEAARLPDYADLGNRVFQGCISLQRVNLPVNMVSMTHQLFAQCVRLSYVELPDGLKHVGSGAFLACSSLKTIRIPEGVTSIGFDAFCDSGLTEIHIPDSVTTIESAVFRSCDDLASVRLPKGLKVIESYTFHGCKSLQEIHLPDTLEYIHNNAFGMCTSLRAIEIPHKVTEIRESCFSGCVSLTEVVLPTQVINVWNYAFSQCTNLKSITMEGVGYIAPQAFFHCASLRTVTLSNQLRTLSGQAFLNCPSLEEVIFHGTMTQWASVTKGKDWNSEEFEIRCDDGVIAH